MGSRSTVLPFVVAALLGHSGLIGQDTPSRGQNEREIKSKLALLLERDYRNQPADELLMLAIQHSDIVVPELKRRLGSYNPQHSKKLEEPLAVQADALAYVANASSVDALADLCNEKPGVFCLYLERTLNYAEGRSNPFTLAYHAVARPEITVQDTVVRWANSMIGFPHFQQRLGEAMLDIYGRAPSDSEWATDPISSQLKNEAPAALFRSVVRSATEAQNKRERR